MDCPNKFAQRLHVIIFALNFGFAITFALTDFRYSHSLAVGSPGHFLLPWRHFFFDSSVSVNRLLGLDRASLAGPEVVCLSFMLLPGLLVLGVLRLIARTALFPAVLYVGGCLVAVALVPACWLYALKATWIPDAIYPFWKSYEWSLFELEVPAVCAVFLFNRRWSIPMWCTILVLVVHYTWWTGVMWPPSSMPLWSPRLFFFVFPCSGIAWLFYARELWQADPGDDA